LEENQKKQAIELRRLEKFNDASNEMAAFESAMMARAESWMIAARNVGSAYKMAAEQHKKTLSDQKASDALDDQILFAILSISTIGALSWLSSAIQNRNATALLSAQTRLASAEQRLANVMKAPPSLWHAQSLMMAKDQVARLRVMPEPVGMVIEALEDTLQVGADKLLTTWAPTLVAQQNEEISDDPQVFQNEQENKVSRVKILAFQAFSEMRTDWGKKPREFWDTYDTAAQTKKHEEWNKEAAQLAGKDDLKPIQEMADELERGFWMRYVLESHSHRDFGIFRTAESYDYVGDHVVKRLEKLGVTKPLGIRTDIPRGVNDGSWLGGDPMEEFITDKLVAWAKAYQVKSLLKPKSPGNGFAGASATATGSVKK